MTEHLSMDSNTGVLVLNDLEDLDYVERRRDPADRRRHIVDITDAGLEALERAEAAQGSIEDEILGGSERSRAGDVPAAAGQGARGPSPDGVVMTSALALVGALRSGSPQALEDVAARVSAMKCPSPG